MLNSVNCYFVKILPVKWSVIFVNENENENGEKQKNNEFVNEN